MGNKRRPAGAVGIQADHFVRKRVSRRRQDREEVSASKAESCVAASYDKETVLLYTHEKWS